MHHYGELLRHSEGSPDYMGAWAWILATSSDSTVRDASESLRLAQAWLANADANDPKPLNTLAAALAENGRFAEAAATMQRAVDAARTHNNTALVRAYESQLQLYRQGKPFRRSPNASSRSN